MTRFLSAKERALEASRLAAPQFHVAAPETRQCSPQGDMRATGLKLIGVGFVAAMFAGMLLPEARADDAPAPMAIVVTMPDGNQFVPSVADTCGEAWAGYDETAFPEGDAECLPLDLE